MTSVLGISAFYHDSAAALISNGKIIAAAQEERFSRKKHDSGYPFHAVEFVLKEANLKLNEVQYITFYEKPFLKFERLLETYVAFAPKGFKSFSSDSDHHKYLLAIEKLKLDYDLSIISGIDNTLDKYDIHLDTYPSTSV